MLPFISRFLNLRGLPEMPFTLAIWAEVRYSFSIQSCLDAIIGIRTIMTQAIKRPDIHLFCRRSVPIIIGEPTISAVGSFLFHLFLLLCVSWHSRKIPQAVMF